MFSSEGLFDPRSVFDRIPEGSTVIDFGCGTGYYSMIASVAAGSSGEVIAVDQDEEALGKLAEKIKSQKIDNIDTFCTDLSDLAMIRANTGDFGLMINVFHGLFRDEEVENVFEEVRRVMKFDALIAIVDYRTDARCEFPEKEIRCSLRMVKELLEPLCFKVKDHLYLNDDFQMILIKKK